MAERYKIFHLVEAALAGVGSHVTTMLANLDQNRFVCHLGYAPGRVDDVFLDRLPKLQARGVTAFEIPMVRSVSPWRDIAALTRIAACCKCNHYDIVHTHSAKAGFLGRLAAHRSRTPVVIYTPNGWPFLATGTRVLAEAYRQLERVASRWCDRIVCVSRHERELGILHRIAPAEKFVVIPNGIDATTITGDRRQARNTLHLSDNALVIGTITRFAYQKDPLGLLEAMQPLLEGNPDLFLVFIGDGPLRPAVQRQAADGKFAPRVRFTGFRADATELLFGFDIFLLPSRYESLSYAVLEAMAAGLPIITTAGGNEDAVRHGSEGLVVPYGDRAKLTDAARQLIEQPTLRQRLGQNARVRVREFTVQRQVAATEALYAGILKEKGVR